MMERQDWLDAGSMRILNEKGELSMFDLCRELSLTFEDVALAIGWLARESKVFFEEEGRNAFRQCRKCRIYFWLKW